jgi:hypothetical protein
LNNVFLFNFCNIQADIIEFFFCLPIDGVDEPSGQHIGVGQCAAAIKSRKCRCATAWRYDFASYFDMSNIKSTTNSRFFQEKTRRVNLFALLLCLFRSTHNTEYFFALSLFRSPTFQFITYVIARVYEQQLSESVNIRIFVNKIIARI